ncbi:hypothetical protein Achl_4003 (plasmid) [Pseudarthrobacter chlorophenolicus A6]|uniref:Uncharacterized protein n=1 Tax=Pseudarthrobacter chlorophenolicus (strain ATCC 700700 / DSM 12829 / CIP 107037 / JCM 12360 / KCTC 9906 / NCIMB 13794 / A6) TaxID=452863 RepID=B8HHQ7_PSECP|nr:hypothetical protein [Pseudarthrobacter chlorophenolicus]ACL41954.1 hypothetical protein Achl_4003 [Pseudarthrobacter chlorophenolicus A6]SDQ19394.1 hypothetical protein SAMN04489738_0654 [Pseudarthrobacter chlorophenolicus]
MSTDRQPRGIPVGGQFAAATRTEPAVSLRTYRDEEHRLERNAVEAIYTAGRGRGRNRHGNIDRITEAYDAAGAYVDSLGEARNVPEADARQAFQELREEFEADKDSLDDKTLRDRKFEVAGQANWVVEYRSSSYNNQGQTP